MRTPLVTSLIAAVTAAILASCHTTVSLDYQPRPGGDYRGPAVFGAGEFRDMRGMDPKFIGSVGVPGVSKLAEVPMENMFLQVTVSEAVRNAVLHGLDARKMLKSSHPKYQISGDIVDLHCELFKNPYAIARIRMNITEGGSSRVVFTKEYRADRQSVFYRIGTGDPVPIMRELTSRALQDAVDTALDDPELRKLIK